MPGAPARPAKLEVLTIWPWPGREHARQEQATTAHHTEQIHFQDLPPLGHGGIHHRATGSDAGVVDQHIQAAPFGDDALMRSCAIASSLPTSTVQARWPLPGKCRAGCFGALADEIDAGNPRSRTRITVGQRPAQAAARAGDQYSTGQTAWEGLR